MKQLKKAILVLFAIMLMGTIGYVLIEKWGILDAFYMTIISMTTTGFAEVRPLTPMGRLFTIGLIVFGVSTIAYIGGRAAQLIIETQIFRRRRVSKKVGELKNHYVVCGYGRLGKPICDELFATGMPFVVIEKKIEKIERLIENNYLFVNGDATSDESLINAGIEKARGLVAVLATDAENVYVTLSAKVLKPDIYVVSRAIEEETEKKLLRAGANRIVKPYEIGASRMVHLLMRPGIVDFMDSIVRGKGIDLSLEEISVRPDSQLLNKTLADIALRKTLNIIVVAIFRKDGTFVYNPTSSEVIREQDRLIAIGRLEDLNQLNKFCGYKR